MKPHPELCACDDCFDKPPEYKWPPEKGRPYVMRHKSKLLKGKEKETTPANNTSPLNEQVRKDTIAFMGRTLSADESKIIDFVIMDMTRYNRAKSNGQRIVRVELNKHEE